MGGHENGELEQNWGSVLSRQEPKAATAWRQDNACPRPLRPAICTGLVADL